MSDKSTDQQSDERPTAPPNLGMQNTPNAERYVLEADAMRRRQLRSALLHGSRRTWREYPRTWLKVIIGLIVVAVILAALAVTEAFNKTKENQEKNREQQRQQSSALCCDNRAPQGADFARKRAFVYRGVDLAIAVDHSHGRH